jgi:hypothetical protein
MRRGVEHHDAVRIDTPTNCGFRIISHQVKASLIEKSDVGTFDPFQAGSRYAFSKATKNKLAHRLREVTMIGILRAS